MLVINISKSKELSKDYANASLLDIPNTIIRENKLSLNSFFNEDQLYTEALNKYKKFINQIASDPKNQSFKVKNLPIYWLSDTGNKNPITHWGKDFFLLLTLLKRSAHLIQEKYNKLVIILPKDLIDFKPSLKELLVNYGFQLDIEILFETDFTKKTNPAQLLKTLISVAKSIVLYKRNNKNEENNNNISDFYLINSLKNNHTYINQFLELQKLFSQKDKDIRIIPILEWRERNIASEETPITFIKSKPNIVELSIIIIQILINYNKIRIAKLNSIEIDGIQFNTSFLKQDLRTSLNKNSPLIFLNEWLQKFFTTQKGRYFYEDEFYSYGKTISFAIKNSNNKHIQSYGIQHGHFNEVHTVYTITDTEIKMGYPLPSKFIVWGEYYHHLIQQNNQLPDNFFLALGNPKHINHKVNNEKTDCSVIKNILWCLTTKECFIAEWNIIKNSLILQNTKLVIRLHPLAHISEKEVTNLLKNINFTFSTAKDLINEFNNVDLIITSAHSTIFLDALVNHKPVVRIITNRWIGLFNINSNLMFNVKNEKDLNLSFRDLLSKNNKLKNNENIIQIDKVKWSNFIQKS
jgi:hypothetical protein